MSIYEKHIFTDRRLPFIFHSYTCKKSKLTAGVGNWHENVEILCFTRGSATVTSNEQRIEVNAGDIAVINSNCLHEIFPHEETHFYCIIVDRSFCVENHFDTNLITFNSKVSDNALFSLIQNIASEYGNINTPYAAQIIRADVLKLLSLLCRNYSKLSSEPHSDTRLLSSIKLALGFITTECHRNISLDEIAECSGISKYHLAREFHRITGYTIVNYINVTRCEKAKHLLSENVMSIENIADVCGFQGASYFSKTFKKHVGVLPSEYRKSIL